MWWTRQRRRADGVAGQVDLVSEIRRAGRTALKRTAKPCGPDVQRYFRAGGNAKKPYKMGSSAVFAESKGNGKNLRSPELAPAQLQNDLD
jgi:hypothetical protein